MALGKREGGSCDAGGWARRLNECMPLLKYLGFALWVAWLGVAYSSSVWVDSVEATSSVVLQMFFSSTLAHAVTLVVAALAFKRIAPLLQKREMVLGGGLLASAGAFAVCLASPTFFYSLPLFVIGGALTGVGSAALCIHAGLLVCAVAPHEALTRILGCEIVAVLVQFMVLGLPRQIGVILFVLLPLFSAVCFAVGLSGKSPATVQEVSRLRPAQGFGRFLLAVGILAVAAYFCQGVYQPVISPQRLADDGSVSAFLTLFCLSVLVVAVSLRPDSFSFSHLFYPLAMVIVLSLLVSYLLPESAEMGLVFASTAFRLFDAITWYVFSYIVYQSKAAATLVIAPARAVISFGVTVGSVLGGWCAPLAEANSVVPTVVFVILFGLAVAVFLIFPEKRADRLMPSIPDEDDERALSEKEFLGELGAPSTNGSSDWRSGIEASSSADTSTARGDDDQRAGEPSCSENREAGSNKERWRRLALQMGADFGLTEREKEVMVLLARGFGSQSISDSLHVSLYTTRAHTRNIYTKLDVHSRQELSERVWGYVETHGS